MLAAVSALQSIYAVKRRRGRRAPVPRRISVVDEGWAILGDEDAARFFQSSLKLSRKWGVSNVLVFHRLADAGAQADSWSAASKIAEGLIADAEVKVIFRTHPKVLEQTAAAFALSEEEAGALCSLPRGRALWKYAGISAVVDHVRADLRDAPHRYGLEDGGLGAMAMSDDGPPRLSRSSGEAVFALVTAVVVVLGMLDLAAVLAELLAGEPARLVSLEAMGGALGELARRPGAPGARLRVRRCRRAPTGASSPRCSSSSARSSCSCAAPSVAARSTTAALPRHSRRSAVASLARRATQGAPDAPGPRREPAAGARPAAPSPLGGRGRRLPARRDPWRRRALALVAHWETSLRLVAPPGEGKTKRFMEPIGAQHPGPVFATSTKSDLYESIVADRARLGAGLRARPRRARSRSIPGALVAGGGMCLDAHRRASRRGASSLRGPRRATSARGSSSRPRLAPCSPRSCTPLRSPSRR